MLTVRDATADDAPRCAAIYAPYVESTAITFELEPPDGAVMAARIAAAQRRHAWLVAEEAGVVVGYAYAGAFRERPAYRWACEVSVYLEIGRRRTGLGRRLYEALLPRLVARGYRRAIAGMALPNDASEALHRALGFTTVGIFRRVGWKHDAWHDVLMMERELAGGDGPPAELA